MAIGRSYFEIGELNTILHAVGGQVDQSSGVQSLPNGVTGIIEAYNPNREEPSGWLVIEGDRIPSVGSSRRGFES